VLKIVNDIEALPEPKPYLRVFWVGGLRRSEKGWMWMASFESLAHGVFRVVWPKPIEKEEALDSS